MLNLWGRSVAERAKSVAICLLLGLLTISLWQVSTENAKAARVDQKRQAAAEVATRFAIALTNYDYAHLQSQMFQVAEVSLAVRNRVSAALSDIASSKASSIGEVSDAVVATVTDSHVEVLVETSQIVGGIFTQTGARLIGLLDVTVTLLGRGWMVTDYRWVLAPSNGF